MSCSEPEPINYRMIEKKSDGIHYKIYTDKAYSGPVFNIKGKSEGYLQDGKWINDLNFFSDDGKIKKTIKYSPTGKIISEKSFDNDILNGNVKYFHSNEKIKKEENYINGKKYGIFKQYDRFGNMNAEIEFKDDKRNGYSKYYFLNGQIENLEFYKNDKKHGSFQYYNESGQLISEKNYKNGQKDGIFKSYFSSLSGDKYLKYIENYKKDKKNGTFKYYTLDHSTKKNPNSKLERIENYKNDKKDGAFKYYNSRGFGDRKETLSIVKEEFYENDQKIGTWKEYDYDWHSLTGYTQEIIAIESFNKGQIDGPFKKFKDKNPNLIIEEGTYDKGIKVGEWKYYEVYTQTYRDGSRVEVTKIAKEGVYVNGKKNGRWTEYAHGGAINKGSGQMVGGHLTYTTSKDMKEIYTYKDDVKDGPFEIAVMGGQFTIGGSVQKGSYQNGKKNEIIKLYNSRNKQVGALKNNVKHGFFIEKGEGVSNYPGTLEGKYENGKRNGPWRSYGGVMNQHLSGEQGKYLRTIIYEDGTIVDYR